ncbi:hypothetical protein DFH11DRAFT_1604461 [Phellopilus nigrolimitatus]|nr:hypothetical protein DFH11DRAFT_1604461 [Phellopilus nigrolimitatus]
MVRKMKTSDKTSDDDDNEIEEVISRPTRRAKVSQQNGGKRKQELKVAVDSDGDDSGEASDAYVNEAAEDDEESDRVSLDSDALDDSDFDAPAKRGSKRKRASTGVKASPKKLSRSAPSSPKKGKGSPVKKRRKASTDDEDEEELADGQEFVGTVVQAPKTGLVPPGQISQNTLNFLRQLQNPTHNDRIWFKLHEPVFRQAEKEWKDFIDEFTPLLTEADPQIPVLPPNDVVHRIYRDVRFSNDKTPYKTNFSASFSRSGRKGIFAVYHLSVKPEGSLMAAGAWCPGKNELQTIRNNITRSSRRMRELISAPAFVELFGEPKPHPKGQRRSIFGMDDELKVAPKGVDKNHKDIDLLKCRTFAVVHRFTDEQVLDPNFKEELKRIFTIVQPFVHGLNDMMTVAPDDSASEAGEADEGEEADD